MNPLTKRPDGIEQRFHEADCLYPHRFCPMPPPKKLLKVKMLLSCMCSVMATALLLSFAAATQSGNPTIHVVGHNFMASSTDLGKSWNTSYLLDWGGNRVFYSFGTRALLFGPRDVFGDGIAVGSDYGVQQHYGYFWRRNASQEPNTKFPGSVWVKEYYNAGWNNSFATYFAGWVEFHNLEILEYPSEQDDYRIIFSTTYVIGSMSLRTGKVTWHEGLCGTPEYAPFHNKDVCSISQLNIIRECGIVLGFGNANIPHCTDRNWYLGCAFATRTTLQKLKSAAKNASVNGTDVWEDHSTSFHNASYMRFLHVVNCTHLYGMWHWNNSDGLMASTDGGATWQPRYYFDKQYSFLTNEFTCQYVTFFFRSAEDIFAYTTEDYFPDRLLHSTDGGYSWSHLFPNATRSDLQSYLDRSGMTRLYTSMTVTVAGVIFKIVQGGDMHYMSGTVLRSTDGGATWTASLTPRQTSWAEEMKPNAFFVS